MSMVEGIGDEVIQFFGAVIIIAIALIAWWSTSISEGPLIRTVLILERHTRGRTTNDSAPQPSVTVNSNESTIDTGQVDSSGLPEIVENEAGGDSNGSDKDENESSSSLLLSSNQQSAAVQPIAGDDLGDRIQETPVSVSQTASDSESHQPCEVEHTQEAEPSVVAASDADSSILRKRRLAFFQSRGPTLIEADVTENESDTASSSNAAVEDESLIINPDHIRIRLKYLNDDQIVVEGRLQEQLGDFKRRHFSIELAAEKMVRLIFNGQVLQSDSQTLQGYGLFDNCVVHCLVHNQRNTSPRSAQPQANSGMNQSTPPDWNLGTLLYTCLSVILGFAWYCRYQYSHLFTVTTTAALFGLTSLFAVTLLSIYLPDQETIQ